MVTLRSEVHQAAMQASHQLHMRFITSQTALEELTFIMRHNLGVQKGLNGLYLTFHKASPVVKTLRELLFYTTKLEDLRLQIPGYSRTHWIHLFANLHLSCLKLLQASAPHEVLAEFLQHHDHIEVIDVTSSCDHKPGHCVLTSLALPNLVDLTGPTSCVANIPDHHAIQGMTFTCHAIADEEYSFRHLIMTVRRVRNTLTHLTLGFNPMNRNLLHHIQTSAPWLRELSLYETTQSSLRCSLSFPQPWNDASTWANDISSFQDLRSLQLTTHISLVRRKGDPPEELALAFQWMSGERNGRRVEQTITRLSLRYLKGLIDETKATLDFVNGWWFKVM
ncbi:hypothetical protein F4604DRAFT_1926633 [Suillus subluteus]|nr:hypothetical protein F4604DRAFT_1926633 [Suillus subluteus]